MNEKLEKLLLKCDAQPENPHLLYLLAQAYTDEGMYSQARDTLTDALMVAEGDFLLTIQKAIEQLASLEVAVSQPETPPSVGGPSFTVLEGGRSPLETAPKTHKVITFGDVGGMDQVKSAIEMKIIKPLLHPELFAQFGRTSGGGILLYGPPGCGKTYIAKAAAGESRASFLNLRITDILDKWIGESERNLENFFIKARTQRPAILFIDEVDMLGFSRTKMSGESMRGVVDHMLSELEGVGTDNEGILIIGATNMPWDIDNALRRPGRFDKSIFVSPPDLEARATIFRLRTAELPCGDLDFELLASRCEFFSGADIVNVVQRTSEMVLEEILSGKPERRMNQTDFLDTINATRPSTLEWLRTMSDYIRYSTQSGQYEDVRVYLDNYKGRI